MRTRRLVAGLAAACLVAATAVACTDDEPRPIGPYELVFFDSCGQALDDLRAATKAAVQSYGYLPYGGPYDQRLVDAAAEDSAEGPMAGAAPNSDGYSGTNTHETGVDEPDLVKTDGRRIVTVSQGRLSVVDVVTRQLVGTVDLHGTGDEPGLSWDGQLLLAGDHALVIGTDYGVVTGGGSVDGGAVNGTDGTGGGVVPDEAPPPAGGPEGLGLAPADPAPTQAAPDEQVRPDAGAVLLLVDLTSLRVLSRARAAGYVVDARQVGSTVRVVLRSAPDFAEPPIAATATDKERITAMQAVIDAAGIDSWAPWLEVTTGGQTTHTQVACDAISRPATYTGANLVTILSFDVTGDALTDGRPVTVSADGDTVYSNGTSLYVASNPGWIGVPVPVDDTVVDRPAGVSSDGRTAIYRFDTSGEQPRYLAGGSVPGRLLNQYALSEWDGRLRVATTVDATTADATTESGIHVLATDGGTLVEVGSVGGLGRGEQIYAVRFVGPVGYVVTFRRTDPLYTVDLHDPTAPVVRGELTIPGYSAYLHPVGDTRLIGVGQDATDSGSVLGTAVSIFDVADLDHPQRLTQYVLSGGYSEAEFDPHAFLYWPQTGLLVLPVQGLGEVTPEGDKVADPPGALVLRLTDDQLTEAGFVAQPVTSTDYPGSVRRSLVTDGGSTLWTISDNGVMATDAATLAQLAWIDL